MNQQQRRTRTQLLWDAGAEEREAKLRRERQERTEQRMRSALRVKGSRVELPLGTQFGRLTVISNRCRQPGATRPESGYHCRCDCGVEKWIATYFLNSGIVGSCGCFKRAVFKSFKHGQAGTSTHKIWIAMRQRCTLPSQDSYKHYGARGIAVDPAWESFEQFLADMGPRPSRRHTIERKDTNGNYTPTNCVWATHKEQANNKRNNARFSYGGQSLTISQLADISGLSYSVLHQRLQYYGWSVDEAMTTPVIESKRKNRNKQRREVTKEVADAAE